MIINKTVLTVFSMSFSLCLLAQTIQKGPYTVALITNGVYHIEDANNSNPAGMHTDGEGKTIGMNNCSDMYLVVGEKKAMLIDLSNAVDWDSTAKESLRSVVYERVGKKEFIITVTHKHGDHLGMLPAFADDPKAGFWIPGAEFSGMKIFPEARTNYFSENASYDLGGEFVINTLEVPGHTAHSTVFFLKNKNLVFTGDAIGSGSGVWLFDYDSFINYDKSIDNLIKYIEDPANQIDPDKLVIYGGHYWQRGKMEKLTTQYIYDMQALIKRIGSGTAETKEMSTFIPFLDTNFIYGTATITWNKEAADRYARSLRNQ
jgi:glyoxylase-like metal-dependent hydrolase (beta-lactamase superfamily II)